MTEGYIWFKVVMNTLLVGVAGGLTYLGLDTEVFTLFGYLLLLDYVTGIMKAKAIGEQITSARMKYGILSKLSLVLIPLVLALVTKAMTGTEAVTLLFVSLNMLILSEGYSIIGNIYTINNPDKEELPEWDAVAALGSKIRGMLIKWSGENDGK